MVPALIEILSFGFRDYPRGLPGLSACFDVRGLVNPGGRVHAHRFPKLNGTHSAVASFVLSDPRAQEILDQAYNAAIKAHSARIKSHPGRIGFGCFAGKHRSVVLAETLAARLERVGLHAKVTHLSVGKHVGKRG